MSNIEVTGSNAAQFGLMLSNESLILLHDAGENKINLKNGIARSMLQFKRDYGEQTFLNFPRPGSKSKDHASNVLTDFGPWGDEGKQASWYAVLYSGSKQGKQLAATIQKHKDSKADADNVSDWDATLAAYMTRQNTAIARIKDAVKLNIQMYLINQETECTVKVIMDGDDVIRSTKCIFIRNEDGSKFKTWTIGQLMQVDVAWSSDQKGGATWDNVMKSTKRNQQEPKTGFKVSKPVEFDTGVAAMTSYLTHIRESENEKEYKSFVSHLNEAGSDYLILSMDDLYSKLEQYLELPSVKDRLLKLHEAGGLRSVKRVQQANVA